ncbi:phage tail spike protein, partial [Staphylococcus haemolyticus]|uniref:phage tail spike protein n=1 Tax=Staphylococcus haemolyticus TaxID=1283 RepID=UPI000B20B2AE
EMFKTFIERYGYEFKIVNNVVYLYTMIGNDTNFEYRYKINASNIVRETSADEMYTYVEGYADYDDESDDKDPTKIAKLKPGKMKNNPYISPFANLVGELHAPPIRDGRIKKEETLLKRMQEVVDNSFKISFTADIHDMENNGYNYQHAELGDRVFLVDERINLDTEIRVVKIERDFDARGKLSDIKITFGTLGDGETYASNLNSAMATVNDLMTGKKVLPNESLTLITQSMVKKIQDTSSELVFDNNGIHAIDKQNANNIVTLNSNGLYLSTDGGQTGKTAITAEGIAANAITTGSLNANLISVTGGDKDKFIEMQSDYLTLYGTFRRTWQNETTINNVYTRLKDGHLRFRNNDLNRSIYVSDFGISTYIDGSQTDASGTLEFFDYTYSPTNSARGVTLNSAGGAVALNSERNRIVLDANATVNIESEEASVYVRPMKNNRNGSNEFRLWVKNNDAASDTDGVITYGSITSGSEYGSGIRFDKNKSSNFVYATNNNGDIGSGDFHARSFVKASSAEFKENIKEWNYDALSVIAKELQLYSYNYKSDREKIINHGPIIGTGYKTPVEFIHNNGIDTNEMLSWAFRAIQQLNEKIEVLENGK